VLVADPSFLSFQYLKLKWPDFKPSLVYPPWAPKKAEGEEEERGSGKLIPTVNTTSTWSDVQSGRDSETIFMSTTPLSPPGWREQIPYLPPLTT
jgi:hypothetical protein